MADLSLPEAAERIAMEDGRPGATWYRVFARLVSQFNTNARSVSDSLGTKATLGQAWSETVVIDIPDDGDYVFPAVAGDFSITSVVTECDSGTCTATVKIDGVALGGSANAVSILRNTQTHSSANTHADGDDITVTISANASCERLSLTMIGTRTLD